MITIGITQFLNIDRLTDFGLFLGDNEGNEVLLPNKYVPKVFEIGEEMNVFVYLDHEERPVATTLVPYVVLNEFALLRVNYVNQVGAFLDWGMEKDILEENENNITELMNGLNLINLKNGLRLMI